MKFETLLNYIIYPTIMGWWGVLMTLLYPYVGYMCTVTLSRWNIEDEEMVIATTLAIAILVVSTYIFWALSVMVSTSVCNTLTTTQESLLTLNRVNANLQKVNRNLQNSLMTINRTNMAINRANAKFQEANRKIQDALIKMSLNTPKALAESNAIIQEVNAKIQEGLEINTHHPYTIIQVEADKTEKGKAVITD